MLELAWFSGRRLVQLILTMGLAFLLSALTVHFRDIRDILGNLMTFWFFATPDHLSVHQAGRHSGHYRLVLLLRINPFTHLAIVPGDPVSSRGPFGHWHWLLVLGAISIVCFLFGYFVFDRLRDTFAEEVSDERHRDRQRHSKIYRRYSHKTQFATLKSALLSRSLVRDLRPDETFPRYRT